MPVKTLIRAFLSLFDSTITEPKFIATHLNQAISLSNNNNITHNGYLLYPPHLSSPDIEEELHTVVYNTDHTPTEVHAVVYNTDHSLTEVSSFEIPYVLGGTNIVAFCNGLFCLTNNSEKNLADQSLYLWNPGIKMFKMVPTQFPDCHSVSRITFGFAHQNNDFKILRLVCFASGGAEAQEFILSFDVDDGRVRGIMPPQNYVSGCSEFLAVFKGSLALIVFTDEVIGENDVCDIWVMKEYGVSELWTKKSVTMEINANLIGCSVNGELLIEQTSHSGVHIISFDSESLNEENLGIPQTRDVIYTADFGESLVLLNGADIKNQ
ncbi:uncharacterized protein LOC136071255 [Quercus suber]|uniref:uncharacterized protein LOC136071255 n=1 Tax=Quercus suber TaxID=58331 RepID=UPI0032E036D3